MIFKGKNMPGPIENLKMSLKDTLSGWTRNGDFSLGKPDLMEEAYKKTRDMWNRPEGNMIPKDRIREALDEFYRTRLVSDSRHLHCLCWGAVMSNDKNSSLIENDLFPGFIKALRGGTIAPRSWRGLLSGYFQYNPCAKDKPAGKSNWESLRKFLAASFPGVYQGPRHKRLWMEILNSNLNLLRENPCQKYAKAILDGDDSEIQSLKKDLQIPDASWFWGELIFSQIDRIAGFEDTGFKERIDKIIPHLRESVACKSEGLKRILNRYHECAETEAHEGLKQFAVSPEGWGNPQLSREGSWGLVDPKVKQMVQGWLALEDLRDFFDLLQTDGRSDERRFDFWSKYIKQIHYSRIVLGDKARANEERDYRELRERKKGRLSRLKDSPPSNNAFIMGIDRYYFVEFTETGNACYGYSKEKTPFRLEDVWQSLKDLKNKPQSELHERHRDASRRGNWEDHFKERLERFGIYQDDPDRQSGRKTSPPLPSSRKADPEKCFGLQDQNFESQFREFVKKHSLKVVADNRKSGGCIHVYYDHYDDYVANELRRFGFNHSWHTKHDWWKE